MKKFLSVFVLSLSLSFALNAQTPLTTAVDFTATDVHGTSHTLFTYLDAGKYVLIDFFYVTCPYCQATAPDCNASYEHFGCNTGDVIFLGVDLGDSDAQVLAFDNTYGVNYPCISGDAGGSGICSTYGISAYPTYILIAPNHSIVEQDMWPYNESISNTTLEGHGITPMSCPVSIEELENETNLISGLYPNPAKDNATLTFYSEAGSQYRIEIFNTTGQLVYSQQLYEVAKNAEYKVNVNTESLANGTYSLRLISDERMAGQTMLVIAR
ncbi:MAG: hypothetical protein C0592_07605 [Marinilabiliales bacterium]|nr:MAG: hypothetical protein C0592_07605 [Marinilabiliales bacterium]